ncbi:hypothetical protein HMPREF9446_01825 [Bacteroides fluxus YIT 12057]|uniref:Uncharacterized protein n=1 Tax=Bacteroides fluxus YIT 12057 TaxID=763034 RepID=F3PSW3_9BACE|nr:hypothetical protein HMPREF9446_01825 [Bacteroides fluxus YIT 12057]
MLLFCVPFGYLLFFFECRQALGIIEQFSTYIVSLGRFYIYLSRNFKHNEL